MIIKELDGLKDGSNVQNLFGWVDNESQEVTGIKIPGGLSFLIDQLYDQSIMFLIIRLLQNLQKLLDSYI